MKFDNIKQMKTVAEAVLLLLLAAAGYASPLRQCGKNQFYDDVAQICTNCHDICDPRRGTSYLCKQHADECSTRE